MAKETFKSLDDFTLRVVDSLLSDFDSRVKPTVNTEILKLRPTSILKNLLSLKYKILLNNRKNIYPRIVKNFEMYTIRKKSMLTSFIGLYADIKDIAIVMPKDGAIVKQCEGAIKAINALKNGESVDIGEDFTIDIWNINKTIALGFQSESDAMIQALYIDIKNWGKNKYDNIITSQEFAQIKEKLFKQLNSVIKNSNKLYKAALVAFTYIDNNKKKDILGYAKLINDTAYILRKLGGIDNLELADRATELAAQLISVANGTYVDFPS
jgi:hypothetical protein